MAFSPDFLDELRDRNGLVAVIGRGVKLLRRGREWTGLCPFHKEKTPSFTVNEEKGFYHCFGCAAHGTVFDFVMQTEGLSFPEAVERLAREAGIAMPERSHEARETSDERTRLGNLMESAADWFQAQLAGMAGAAARDYLQGRGIGDAAVASFRLGLAPARGASLAEAMTARGFTEAEMLAAGLLRRSEERAEVYPFFRDRIIFPIQDRRGRVIAFGGRALGEARAKYLNSPDSALFHKGRTLYNLAAARGPAFEAGAVIVAEGYMDVIALDRAGLRHAVAPLGTALTEEQMAELWRLSPEPVLCLDGDAAGRRAAARAAERALPLLQPGCSLRFAELPLGEDPDSLVAAGRGDHLRALLDAALPLHELLWRGALADRPLDSPERRAALRRDLGQLCAQIRDDGVRTYYKDHFRERLARQFSTETAQRRGWGMATRRGNSGYKVDRKLNSHLGLIGENDSQQRFEAHLVAIVLNAAGLIDEVYEEFASLQFHDRRLDRLRGAILEQVGLGDALDAGGLKNHLSDNTLCDLIDELTEPGAPTLPPFARAGVRLDEARAGWSRVRIAYHLPELKAELRQMASAYESDPSEQAWQRLLELKAAEQKADEEIALYNDAFDEPGTLPAGGHAYARQH